MERPVAVLDYSVDGKSGALIASWLSPSVRIVRITDGEVFPRLDKGMYRAVIHSGSSHSILADPSFIGAALDLVTKLIEWGVPQMGICYGHQLLARATLGMEAVERCESIELGWRKVDFLPVWPVPGFSGRKAVWQSHYDRVVAVPEGAFVTATNEHTEIQAFVDNERKLFGTQFHPEFDRQRGNEAFAGDTDIFLKNGIEIRDVLESGPDFETGRVVFQHFFRTFERE